MNWKLQERQIEQKIVHSQATWEYFFKIFKWPKISVNELLSGKTHSVF